MAIQFPADPAAQTPINTFSPISTPVANTANTLVYVWNGSAWIGSGDPVDVTPNLQAVTDQGNTTTNQITLPGGGGEKQALQKQEVESLIAAVDAGVSKLKAGNGISLDPAAGTGEVTITSAGGGGGTSTPQKVAFLSQQKPAGTYGDAAVVGWQTRVLNTKEDPDNLVVLNDNKFTLSAGKYLIEWNAPAFRVNQHQTKLTNVTDSTTQAVGSPEFASASDTDGENDTNRTFGSTLVNITSDTTYKIEHYCSAENFNGLGVLSAAGEPGIYTQVTITDLSSGGGGSGGGSGSGADAWGNISSDGTLAAGFNASVVKVGSGIYDITFTTPMSSSSYSVTATAQNPGSRSTTYDNQTATGFRLVVTSSVDGTATNTAASFAVFASEGGGGGGGGTTINYNGASAWGLVTSAGTIQNGQNIKSVTRSSSGSYSVEFQEPLSTSLYAAVVSGSQSDASGIYTLGNQTTTGFEVRTTDKDGNFVDYAFTFAVFASNAIAPQYGVGADAAVKMNANGTSAPIIKYGYNIKEAKRTGIGEYEIFFNTPMPTSQYAVTLSSNGGKVASLSGTQTDKFIVLVQNPDGVPAEGNVCADVHASSTITPTYTWTRDGTTLKPANDGDDISADGSATIGTWANNNNPAVQVGKLSATTTGIVKIKGDGSNSSALSIRANGNSAANEVGSIKANGDAAFRNTRAANVIFELERDDPNNYVSTTNAETGETESVYSGPQLDVKQLLLEFQTKIETLEAAKASLEARLSTLEGGN